MNADIGSGVLWRGQALERGFDRFEFGDDLRGHDIAKDAGDRQADDYRDDRVLRHQRQQYRTQPAPPDFRRAGYGKDGGAFAFNRAHATLEFG